MSALTLPAAGGCRCDALRFRVAGRPLLTTACHCRGCQRMSGSAFALGTTVFDHDFEVTAGFPVLGGLKSGAEEHMFCPTCMTWVYTKGEAHGNLVVVRSTLFDETGWIMPFLEVNTAERLPWARLGAPHQYETVPIKPIWLRHAAEYRERLTVKET